MARQCMTLTDSICRGCKDNAGGIKKVYLTNEIMINWEAIETNEDGSISNIEFVTGQYIDPAEASWHVYQVNKYSSSWTETINVADTGNVSYQQVASLVFSQNDQDKRNAIEQVSSGEVAMIIVDNNNTMWLIGEEDNCAGLSGGNSTSGTALSDMNGWTLEFTCNAARPAVTIAKDATAGEVEGTPITLQSLLDEADSECRG